VRKLAFFVIAMMYQIQNMSAAAFASLVKRMRTALSSYFRVSIIE